MGILSARTHAFLDWGFAFLLACAPAVFHFAGVAATLSWLAAIGHLTLSLVTDYPLGASPKVRFATHGTVELATALFLIAAPWAFGFDGDRTARAFFLFAGYALEVLWLFTSYQEITGIRARDTDYRLARATSVSATKS
jgi:hypothetical protein